MKAKFLALNGMDRTPIEAESIVLECNDGSSYELHFRKNNQEVSLSVERGTLVILPRSSNVCRLENRK